MTFCASPRMARSDPSDEIASLLRDGDLAGKYKTRSEADQAIALGVLNAGWTCHDFGLALLDSANGGGQKVREIARAAGEPAAWKYIELCWRKACRRYEASPPAAGPAARRQREAIAYIESAAGRATWKGTTGASALAILDAHVVMARRAGNVRHRASVREAAQLANVSAPTALYAQRRLVDRGWLVVLEPGRGAVSTRWLLRAPNPD